MHSLRRLVHPPSPLVPEAGGPLRLHPSASLDRPPTPLTMRRAESSRYTVVVTDESVIRITSTDRAPALLHHLPYPVVTVTLSEKSCIAIMETGLAIVTTMASHQHPPYSKACHVPEPVCASAASRRHFFLLGESGRLHAQSRWLKPGDRDYATTYRIAATPTPIRRIAALPLGIIALTADGTLYTHIEPRTDRPHGALRRMAIPAYELVATPDDYILFTGPNRRPYAMHCVIEGDAIEVRLVDYWRH